MLSPEKEEREERMGLIEPILLDNVESLSISTSNNNKCMYNEKRRGAIHLRDIFAMVLFYLFLFYNNISRSYVLDDTNMYCVGLVVNMLKLVRCSWIS